ncbi:hypothetical protein MPSEU_000903400 [Mayamaea pseudoterrestris]|nr:hypothetical protein MPSEU_000903400 [Mayamaea pseudoterrestris]
MSTILSPPQNGNSLSNEEQITLTFRQTACWLAAQATRETKALNVKCAMDDNAPEELDTSLLPSMQVAQYLLDNGHPGFIPAKLHTELMSRQGDESITSETINKADNTVEVYLPCCKQCGAVLQPGHDGTRVRVMAELRASRTRRRRAQAKLRRQKRIRKNDVQYARIHDYGQQMNDSSDRLQEQCLQLTCGTCGACTYAPTHCDNKNDGNMGSTESLNASKMQITNKVRPTASKSKQQAVGGGRNKPATSNDNLEFIRLPTSKRPSDTPAQLLTLDQPRKKKKKKQAANPLMDFLSSLNS